jgi:pyridoxine 5-phosphate synthase
MIKLGVNIDHVATLRNARGGAEPEPVAAAHAAFLGGADGITIHLREDRRHIIDRDLAVLKETSPLPLNLEMACTDEITAIARQMLPRMCTLVPERREELTTEGGLDVVNNFDVVTRCVGALAEKGIMVSLFIDAEPAQIEAAQKTGAAYIELHTGAYADAYYAVQDEELKKLFIGAEMAISIGLGVNAGHGLNYTNILPVLKIDGLHEVNIGHSILSRAIFTGLTEAVRQMKALITG